MGTRPIDLNYTNGDTIESSHTKQYGEALAGEFVPHDLNGQPISGGSLGTNQFKWGAVKTDNLEVGGKVFDENRMPLKKDGILNSRKRMLSDQGDFVEITAGSLSGKVLGATTPLIVAIDGSIYTFNQDIDFTCVAGPSSNNSASVNDGNISNNKYVGEIDYIYNDIYGYFSVDGLGSEWTARNGQTITCKNGTEIIEGILSTDKIRGVKRGRYTGPGGFLRSVGLSDDSSLTLLNTGWGFIDVDGNVEVSFKTPVYSSSVPAVGSDGDRWFNTTTQQWNKSDGTAWTVRREIPIFIVAVSDTEIEGYRCFEFNRNYSQENNLRLAITSNKEVMISDLGFSEFTEISVGGVSRRVAVNTIKWNIDNNVEVGFNFANETYGYLFIDQDNRPFIGDRPFLSIEKKGFYHQFQQWRCVGRVYKNASGNLDASLTENEEVWQNFNTQIQYGPRVQSGSSISRIVYEEARLWTHPLLLDENGNPWTRDFRLDNPSVSFTTDQSSPVGARTPQTYYYTVSHRTGIDVQAWDEYRFIFGIYNAEVDRNKQTLATVRSNAKGIYESGLSTSADFSITKEEMNFIMGHSGGIRKTPSIILSNNIVYGVNVGIGRHTGSLGLFVNNAFHRIFGRNTVRSNISGLVLMQIRGIRYRVE